MWNLFNIVAFKFSSIVANRNKHNSYFKHDFNLVITNLFDLKNIITLQIC